MPKPTRRERKQGPNKPRPTTADGGSAGAVGSRPLKAGSPASSRVQVPSRPSGAPKPKKAAVRESAEATTVKARDRVSEPDDAPQVLPAPKSRLPLYVAGAAAAAILGYWIATRDPETPPTTAVPGSVRADAGTPAKTNATLRPTAATAAPPPMTAPAATATAPPASSSAAPSSSAAKSAQPPPPATATAKAPPAKTAAATAAAPPKAPPPPKAAPPPKAPPPPPTPIYD